MIPDPRPNVVGKLLNRAAERLGEDGGFLYRHPIDRALATKKEREIALVQSVPSRKGVDIERLPVELDGVLVRLLPLGRSCHALQYDTTVYYSQRPTCDSRTESCPRHGAEDDAAASLGCARKRWSTSSIPTRQLSSPEQSPCGLLHVNEEQRRADSKEGTGKNEQERLKRVNHRMNDAANPTSAPDPTPIQSCLLDVRRKTATRTVEGTDTANPVLFHRWEILAAVNAVCPLMMLE